MENIEADAISDYLILPHYGIIATLMVLLDKSDLTHTVKTHCKTGLKVIGTLYADTSHNTGTHLLSKKEFDAFFALFPKDYYYHRALISAHTIIKNIELWVKTNEVVYTP